MKEKLGRVSVPALTAAFLILLLVLFLRDREDTGYRVETQHEAAVEWAVKEPPININAASAEELEELPGIGKALAGRIVDWRRKNGPFAAKEDIMQVRGISESVYEGLSDLITVEGKRYEDSGS